MRYHHRGRLPGYCPEPSLDPPDDGQRSCPTCNETGEAACPVCDGECNFESVCENCENTGRVECPDCEGCGFLYKGQATAQEEGAYEDAMEAKAELRREREEEKKYEKD